MKNDPPSKGIPIVGDELDELFEDVPVKLKLSPRAEKRFKKWIEKRRRYIDD